MTYKQKDFNYFTTEGVINLIDYDYKKAIDMFADLYVVSYKTSHDITNLYNLINKRNLEIQQALDISKNCLKMLEEIIQNRN